MRVLQLGKFYPIRGGVEKVMWDLVGGLGEKGVECDMLCTTTGKDAGTIIRRGENARVICVKAFAMVAATMLSPAMVFYLRKHHDYDIIHVHHPDPMAALALFLSGYKGKVIVHWHSDILSQKVILFFYKPLQNWLLRRASLIVGTTPVYVRESPHLRKFQDKISYLPIGVTSVVAKPELVSEIGARYYGKKLVFALGRFVEYKGFEFLVRAAALLPEDYQFVIAGDGPLKESVIELGRSLGVADRITYPGRISEEEKAAYFAASDLYVLSSIHKTEAFAIVQIEAMSAGCPVVATKIPASGVSWVNADGESGLNVPVRDPAALSEAIRNVCENKTLKETLKAGARSRYERLFTFDSMISGCMDIYRRVLNR